MINVKNELAKIQQSAITDPRFKHHNKIVITHEAEQHVAKLFNSILPNFPAWRQTCPDNESLGRMKLAYTKAILRHEQTTGVALDIQAGLLACERSDSDWMPSAGKFIKWCEKSNDLLPLAQRALELFNSGQKQVDTVGKMVTSKYSFDLKRMDASKTEKRFIELYLQFAANNPIEPLESYLLTETVQLSEEQAKDAKDRAEVARNSFFSQFKTQHAANKNKHEKKLAESKTATKLGVKQGSLKTYNKSPRQLEIEKQRQLKMIQGRLK